MSRNYEGIVEVYPVNHSSGANELMEHGYVPWRWYTCLGESGRLRICGKALDGRAFFTNGTTASSSWWLR